MDRLIRVFAIRPGEGRLVALVAGAFAAIEAGRGMGDVGVYTLVLGTEAGADLLPVLYVGLGLTSLVLSLTYGAALSRSRSERFFPGLLLVLAGVLAVQAIIALSDVGAIIPFVWISVSAAGLLLLTVIWTVGGFTFDARQAKRLFPLLTSAAIVGSLSGSLSAILIASIFPAQALILGEAILFVVAAVLLLRLGPRIRPRRRVDESDPSILAAVTTGAAYVRRSRLMRLVAVAYVLLAVLMFSLEFPFMRALGAEFDPAARPTVLALFSASVTVASFLIASLLANRLYARLGVASAALALPFVYLGGFGIWLVQFGFGTAAVARFAQQVTQRGVTNAAFSAFYNVIPSNRRGQVMAFMDGVPGQAGTILSGILLIVATTLAQDRPMDEVLDLIFILGLVTAVIAIGVQILIRRSYAASLVGTLREGLGEQVLDGGPGLAAMASDGRVIEELREATRSERASERQLAADLLGRLGTAAAVDDLVRLAGDEAAGVRRTALIALGSLAPSEAEPLLEAALDDDDAEVRAAAIETLCSIGAQDTLGPSIAKLTADPAARVRCELAVALDSSGLDEAAREIVDALLASAEPAERVAGLDALARFDTGVEPALVVPLLDDPAGSVRAAAIGAADAHDLVDDAALLTALADPDGPVRDAAATALARRPDVAPQLVELLEASDGRVQEAALASLGRCGVDVHDPLVRWAGGQIARAAELRRHAAVLGHAEETSAAAYLGQVVSRREAAIETRMLSALAILGAPEASGLIRRNLRAADAETRAQAIEAVDALGDPRLARGIVRLLDSDTGTATARTGDIISSAQALADDPDPWVRALALRSLAEYLEHERHALAERIRVDPDALIRDVVDVPEGGEPMTDSVKLVSDVDRMLILRRVPLFAALAPEDLQRVASLTTERSWAPGDALMTEGDIGSELVVIVEGSVRVVRSDDDADVLRTYGPGDHIGELAVLREAPRAATVRAEQPGVRGLVIQGEAVQALLRERPDAAMAMLATLAERISTQR